MTPGAYNHFGSRDSATSEKVMKSQEPAKASLPLCQPCVELKGLEGSRWWFKSQLCHSVQKSAHFSHPRLPAPHPRVAESIK